MARWERTLWKHPNMTRASRSPIKGIDVVILWWWGRGGTAQEKRLPFISRELVLTFNAP